MTHDKRPTPFPSTDPSHPSDTSVHHWLAYNPDWREGRQLKESHVRDGAALWELSTALSQRGCLPGSMVRNGPAPRELVQRNYARIVELVDANEFPLIEEVCEYQRVDESFLQPGVKLVVPTRLPLNDVQQKDRSCVEPSFTSIERKLLRLLRRYVEVCSRSRVRLAEAVASRLDREFATRADIEFHPYKNPIYKEMFTIERNAKGRKMPKKLGATAAYVLQLSGVPELNGADVLIVWGMSGPQTLALAHLLRTDLSRLLDLEGFSMVEMFQHPDEPTPHGWRRLDYMHRFEVKVLLEGVLPPSLRRGRRKKHTGARAPRVKSRSPEAYVEA